MGDNGERPLVFLGSDEFHRGGFRAGRPVATAGVVHVIPAGRQRTADDDRALLKRVAKRRRRKGYA